MILPRSLLIYALVAVSCIAAASQTISTKFSYTSAELDDLGIVIKHEAAFLVYLPSLGAIPRRSTYLDIVEDNDYKYYIELEKTPRCMGGISCSVGAIIGHKDHDPTVPILSGKRVALANGGTGYWAEHQCAYLGCAYNGITFERLMGIFTKPHCLICSGTK